MIAKFLLLLFIVLPSIVRGQFEVPALTGPVVDQANQIKAPDERLLNQVIRDFHQRGKGQIQILTLPNLGGLTIEQASIQITDRWRLGNQNRDDGVLILVAVEERRLRIEVGQGLEGVLPDVTAKRIVSDVVTPLFRQGRASEGLLAGAIYVMKTIDPAFEIQEGVYRERKPSLVERYEGLFVLVFIIFMMFLNLVRPRRAFLGGFGGRGPWGGGGFGGGFGGGGGGWSGGGGGFSGGGASGSW